MRFDCTREPVVDRRDSCTSPFGLTLPLSEYIVVPPCTSLPCLWTHVVLCLLTFDFGSPYLALASRRKLPELTPSLPLAASYTPHAPLASCSQFPTRKAGNWTQTLELRRFQRHLEVELAMVLGFESCFAISLRPEENQPNNFYEPAWVSPPLRSGLFVCAPAALNEPRHPHPCTSWLHHVHVITRISRSLVAGTGRSRDLLSQSYVSKGVWRRGIGSFARNAYASTLCPVVICPYLCTSDRPRCHDLYIVILHLIHYCILYFIIRWYNII